MTDTLSLLRVLGLTAALASPSACATFFPPPTVEVVEVGLVSLGLTSGTAAVTLDLTNTSKRELSVRGFRYELQVRDVGPGGEEKGSGWMRLAGGFHSQEVSVRGADTERIVVPVPFEYRALGAALRSFLAQGEVPYRLSGEVSVKGLGLTFDVPFRTEGVLGP